MRRALAILRAIAKYIPAALCALLLVAWATSPWAGIAAGRNRASGFVIELSGGDVWLYPGCTEHALQQRTIGLVHLPHRTYFGRFQSPTWSIIGCPIPFLLTLLVPFAIGPFARYRFPLWSWFAWTALVAAELALYLR